ncbi:hypothetical protein GCM10023148_31630 [Actinokineospora soli]
MIIGVTSKSAGGAAGAAVAAGAAPSSANAAAVTASASFVIFMELFSIPRMAPLVQGVNREWEKTARIAGDAGHRVWTCAFSAGSGDHDPYSQLRRRAVAAQARAVPTIPAPFPFTAGVNISMGERAAD